MTWGACVRWEEHVRCELVLDGSLCDVSGDCRMGGACIKWCGIV